MRQVIEGLQRQGTSEKVAYELTITGYTPTSVVSVVVCDDGAADVDVSDTVLDGAAAIVGGVVVTPYLQNLEVDHVYHVVVTVLVSESSNRISYYFRVRGEL